MVLDEQLIFWATLIEEIGFMLSVLVFWQIEAWRSRGCLPVVIEVTASIIEIQQKDPHFR